MKYSRRHFLKQNSLAGLGIMSMGSIAAYAGSKSVPVSSIFNENGLNTIEDLNLEKLKEKYNNTLTDFIPKLDKAIVDHELGGFMCTVNLVSGERTSTNKNAWYEGRGIWTYSFLYNNFGKDPLHLEIARKSKDFILKNLPADDGFFISNYTKEGKPLSDKEGDIYGNLFVAEGLAEYAKASGEKQYFEQAKNMVLKAFKRYDSPDFTYPYKSENRIKGPRILGHWMLLLSVSTQMLRQKQVPELEVIADRCVDAIMNHHINPEYNVLNEALSHDLKPLSDPVASRFGDIGHGCETLAFVMNYAVHRKDRELFKKASEQFKRHVTIAKDDVYGGYFGSLDNIETNTFSLSKARWVQEEILAGALTMIEHGNDTWALNCFAETEKYVTDKFSRPGYSFVIRSGDRKVEKHSQVALAEHYHYPRQLMHGLLAFDRMLENGKKTSGIFG